MLKLDFSAPKNTDGKGIENHKKKEFNFLQAEDYHSR